MNRPVLLAKSDGTTLIDHTGQVVKTAEWIHRVLLSAPNLVRAAFYHDFGKAAKFFQTRMNGGRPENWYRHELFSLLIVCSVSGRDALTDLELAAIITHHKNLNRLERNGSPGLLAWAENGAVALLRDLAQSELTASWGEMQRIFGKLPRLKPAAAINFIKRLYRLVEQSTFWGKQGRQLGMYRAALVAADHLASSQVGLTVAGNNIGRAALEAYAQSKISCWKGWSFIQREAANEQDSAMLIAPTGAGKTEAAELWALANRRQYERIFYVLPYQVSINAMADRIAKAFPDEQGHERLHENDNISILHSNMDLAYLRDALDDELSPEKARAAALANSKAARKIYAPIKVTTVYQLLDIFFGRKFFEVGMLELTESLVIFDEIHAYDGHTMGLILVLLKYLRKLNARIFIMTATLPSKLKEKLQQAADIRQEIRLPAGDPLLAEVRRVIVRCDCVIEDMIEAIRQSVLVGKKTVVVCNTVKKAIRMWESLREFQPLLVHSRFTLGDRANRETKENIEKHALVISTQVIEVSLDVSFEVMFTELAPVDSLLQRFGRVNRHGPADPSHVGICYIACGEDRGSRTIYGSELLDRTLRHLPLELLTFEVACNWIEKVYPEGLSEKQEERMEKACDGFDKIVAQLKPMIDAPVDVETEMTLFDTVQVIPKEYEEQWLSFREKRQYLEAKELVVNVSLPAWFGAGQTLGNYYENTRIQPANFEYAIDTGLRLDKRI
jgi:CRISPR-associated endonuclease/helicase Cas3